jgi:hypothetical protein
MDESFVSRDRFNRTWSVAAPVRESPDGQLAIIRTDLAFEVLGAARQALRAVMAAILDAHTVPRDTERRGAEHLLIQYHREQRGIDRERAWSVVRDEAAVFECFQKDINP